VGLVAVALLLGLGGAVQRVRDTTAAGATTTLPPPAERAAGYPRLDRPAPELGLVNQHGEVLTLERLEGRPALVTFAFAHCQTVCPLVVRDALAARDRVADLEPVVVVVTLDPWRDTPARLPYVAEKWGLDGAAHVLSGGVADVNATLDRWNVARARDPLDGEITHPRLVYLVNGAGEIVYAVNGGVELIARLAHGL
jgi:cytochrome oxidase Cu insertion factor (SCO1/SenC/PrrC family)